MRPCRFYAKNRKKEGFDCPHILWQMRLYEKSRDLDTLQVVEPDIKEADISCPNFSKCVRLAGETFRQFRKVNVVINNFGNGKVEIIRYNESFCVPEVNIDDVDRRRSFKELNFNGQNCLVQIKDSASIHKLNINNNRSTNRSHDAFKGYSTANKWSYFFTFTFAPSKVDRYNYNVVNSLWRKFKEHLQYLDPGVQILNSREIHGDGAVHFHPLINFTSDLIIVDYGDISKLPQRTAQGGYYKGKTGFCTFTPEGDFTVLPKTDHKIFLVPYYEYGVVQRSSLGDMLFCLSAYKYGRNSCAILPLDDTNQDKVGNYLSVYCSKDCNIGYNKKRFYRTYNLKNKDKSSVYFTDEQLFDELQKNNCCEFKSNGKMTVYRNFNLGTENAVVNKKERLKR